MMNMVKSDLASIDPSILKSRRVFFFSNKKIAKHFRVRADSARDVKNYLESALLYEASLKNQIDNGPVHVQCAHMYKEAGHFEKAEAHYLFARMLMPNDADLYLQLGHFYKVTKRYYEALAAYQRAAAIEPVWSAPRAEIAGLRNQLIANLATDHLVTDSDQQSYFEDTRPGAQTADSSIKTSLSNPAPGTRLTMEQIRESGLFDAEWYLKRYPDIKQLGIDPLIHFTHDGILESRIPGPAFEPEWYVETYPEFKHAGLDPLTHYVLLGRAKGYQPRGPDPYQRWVAAFDTLTDSDRIAIDQHIVEASLGQPLVIVAVDRLSGPSIAKTIRGLRHQRLAPASITLCLAPDCSTNVIGTIRAVVGSNSLFKIVSQSSVPLDMATQGQPFILLEATAELREHAIYIMIQAYREGIKLIYADEDRLNSDGLRCAPAFKPGVSPELLRHVNYLGPCVLLSGDNDIQRLVIDLSSGNTTVADVSRKAFEAATREAIVHVPSVILHDHAAPRSTLIQAPTAMLNAASLPSVSVIIPTRDKADLLRTCITTLCNETNYPHDKIDIIIVDNGSEEQETFSFYKHSEYRMRFRVLNYNIPFNYPKLNNFAAQSSSSDVLVFLNNDTEIQDPSWLRRLTEYAMQPDVGAVGPKLVYEDGTIQHAGVVLSVGGIAVHAHLGLDYDAPGTMGLAQITHEVAAVTGACLAIRRSVFQEVGGLDENLAVAFNDVLLCLACLDRGYRNIYVHDVWVRHYESKTRGVDDTSKKIDIFLREARYTRRKFKNIFRDDPYYSPNLNVNHEETYLPAFPPRHRSPWREHARQSRLSRRILLLSSTFENDNDIGIIARMQAHFFASIGYYVVVGSSNSEPDESFGSIKYLQFNRPEAAATYAVQHDFDCVIVHTWPFLKVARLLESFAVTILYYHENGGLDLINLNGERRAALVDQELSIEAFHAVIAASPFALEQADRADARVYAPGGDRLGCWSLGTLALRNQIRAARNWADLSVIIVGGLPVKAKEGQIAIDRVAALGAQLNPYEVILVVVCRADNRVASDRVLVINHPSDGDTAGIYAAADLYLDLSPPGASSLDSLQAAAFGTPIVKFKFEEYEDHTAKGTDITILRLIETAAGLDRSNVWRRQPIGPQWGEQLLALEAFVARACGKDPHKTSGSAIRLLSDQVLIRQSGLFDAAYYTASYPGDTVVANDPIGHYMVHGWREHKRPSALFHSDWYISRYPEVAALGIDPLTHYLRQSAGPHDPNRYFSNEKYIGRHPAASATGLAPLVHYLKFGIPHGQRYAGPNFDPEFYSTAYPDVRSSGVDPLLHFLREGNKNGRLPIKPQLLYVDPYDTTDIERVVGCNIAWQLPSVSAIIDLWSASRFCIGLLCNSEALRAQFPRALSEGQSGRFAHWILENGQKEFGLLDEALENIRKLFRADISASVMQTYLTREDLQASLPFALTPCGLADYLKYLVQVEMTSHGRLRLEQIRWFAIRQVEDPQKGLMLTYQFSPMLQTEFPDGLTVFGRRALANWLETLCGLRGAWIDPTSWAMPLTDAEQVRVAYAANDTWQMSHPAPFTSSSAAFAFLNWLCSEQSAIAQEARQWLTTLNLTVLAADLAVDGVNMLGHFCYPSGLRTSTEALVEGYRRSGNRVVLRDVWVQPQEAEPRHSEYGGLEVYDTTIIHVQPEPIFDMAYARAGLAPRHPRTHRIGYWYWELETIPVQWHNQAWQVDEVWTATRFVGDALRDRFAKPVFEILPGLELPPFELKPRSYFNLPQDKFLFLFTFHMTSIMERKNPLGLIRAFRLAFPDDRSVGLVIKTSFGEHHPILLKELYEAAAGSSITIIDSLYTQQEVLGLMQACDSYVSLHRSEGYGLTMAEAMLLGKPVVATGYSGNLDFMTPETALLVDYEMVTLDRSFGPYEVGTRWAQPLTRHAADCMRRVYRERNWSQALGKRAQADLKTRMSYDASGARMAARLADIKREALVRAAE